MPARNRIKLYMEDSYYHLYNRGVEKRDIFLDEQDYNVYLSYLKTYLLPKDIVALTTVLQDVQTSLKEKDTARKMLRLNNFADSLDFLAFCLMPNHFHFLVRQSDEDAIDSFMNSLSTRYSMYFNKKYKRVGPLFQGVYKAVLVMSEEQLLYITRYIHRNPDDLDISEEQLLLYPYSSLPTYLGRKEFSWIKPEEILAFFSKQKGRSSYKSFVFSSENDERQSLFLQEVAIDEE